MESPHAKESLASWLPPGSGLAERILEMTNSYPEGFKRIMTDGVELDSLDQDAAEWELHRHLVLKRARMKLKAIYKFTSLGTKRNESRVKGDKNHGDDTF